MSIYKRGAIYWIKFTAPNGQTVQRSARTTDPQAAQELHDKLKHDAWRIRHLDQKPSMCWEDAVIRWLTEKSEKRSIDHDRQRFRTLDPYLRGKLLRDINVDLVDHITQKRSAQGVSNATTNRMLQLLRAVLNISQKRWGWLDSVPHVRLLKEADRRVRFLTREEVFKLLSELPEHLRTLTLFSLATGLRDSNATQLRWQQVDLERKTAWIYGDQAKGKCAFSVPLNDEAVVLIKNQAGKNPEYIFTYEGKPVTRANNHAWRKALKRAGIENFRWHDLRHTWASWHVQNGTPLRVLQELGAWKTPSMVQRYAHLDSSHLIKFAENVLLNMTEKDEKTH